jgi:hypothetical protein
LVRAARHQQLVVVSQSPEPISRRKDDFGTSVVAIKQDSILNPGHLLISLVAHFYLA